jgi:hypothetical protein
MCEVNNQRLRQIILRIQDIEIEKLTVQNKITANNEYKHLTTLLISNYRYVHIFLKAKANDFQDPRSQYSTSDHYAPEATTIYKT